MAAAWSGHSCDVPSEVWCGSVQPDIVAAPVRLSRLSRDVLAWLQPSERKAVCGDH
ncbi:hypothetical protein GCM10009541_32250 [Micromonospora gifhornensis]